MNAASFTLAGAPNSAIARGGILVIFGTDIGPQELVVADEFPLPLEIGGTSIEIRSGGQTFDAVMLYTSSGQAAAVLPSAVPAGEAELVLLYNGEASNAITFQVVEHQVGIFTRSQNGEGIAVLQNYISDSQLPVNGINQSVKPGQVAILWGTGLGAAVNMDDRNPGAVGNVADLDQVKVYVGGKEAELLYAGRSGCCAGVDQINFVVPEGVEGCFVPVTVAVNGTTSNFAAISVDASGAMCNQPYGLTNEQAELLLSKESIRVGTVVLSQNRSTVSALGTTITTYQDLGTAGFVEYSTAGLLDSTGMFGNAVLVSGSCTVSTFSNDSGEGATPPSGADLFRQKWLDAGAKVNILGPAGAREIPKVGEPEGTYQALLNDATNPASSYLQAGDYSVNNGDGGADVGPFSFTEPVPSFLDWTNKGAIDSVSREEGVTVTWTPAQGSFQNGVVAIFGQSWSVPKKLASVVYCFADPSAGSFTIPPYVLRSMVKSEGVDAGPVSIPGGSLSVGGFTAVRTFEAGGLDVGAFAVSSLEVKLLNFD